MFAVRMMQLIETHADVLSEGLARKMRTAPQCQELLRKVPADELKRRSQEIYCHLGEWLTTKTESEIEERYVGLGIRRARARESPSAHSCGRSIPPKSISGNSWRAKVWWSSLWN